MDDRLSLLVSLDVGGLLLAPAGVEVSGWTVAQALVPHGHVVVAAGPVVLTLSVLSKEKKSN